MLYRYRLTGELSILKKKGSLMNTFRTISRVLVVSAVVLVSNAKAVCPLFANQAFNLLGDNRTTIATAFASDKMFDKNEHFKKAFIGTMGSATDNTLDSVKFMERLAVDYTIRKGSELVNINGLRDKALKTCDVLPEGPIRDTVNPVVQGTAELVTHPEVLTSLAMQYVIPMVMGMLKKTS
jgi:hypothetical protein